MKFCGYVFFYTIIKLKNIEIATIFFPLIIHHRMDFICQTVKVLGSEELVLNHNDISAHK